MALTDLLPGRSLSEKHAAAVDAVANAKAVFNERAFEAESGDSAAVKARDVAKRALDQAEARVVELNGALAVAQKHQTARELVAEKVERARRWKATIEAAKGRQAAAIKVEKAIVAFTQAWTGLTAAGAAVAAECPTRLIDGGDLHGHMVRADSLALIVQLEMRRAGLEWVLPGWPEPVHTMASLTDRLGRVDEVLARLQSEDGAA